MKELNEVLFLATYSALCIGFIYTVAYKLGLIEYISVNGFKVFNTVLNCKVCTAFWLNIFTYIGVGIYDPFYLLAFPASFTITYLIFSK